MPTASEVDPVGDYYIKSFPGGDINASDPANIKGHHTLHLQPNTPVLLPIIVNGSLSHGSDAPGIVSGLFIKRGFDTIISCNTANTDCDLETGFRSTGYSNIFLSPSIINSDNSKIYYLRNILKIDPFSEVDKGEWYIQDGANPHPIVKFTLTDR